MTRLKQLLIEVLYYSKKTSLSADAIDQNVKSEAHLARVR